MLEIEDLAVAAGGFRLDGVNLAMVEGECHAVLGPSGAGKSTLLHAVLGTLAPERGSIRLNGEDISRIPIEQRGIGYLPQRIGLFPHLSVRDNLHYSARARAVPPHRSQPLIEKLVAKTGIALLLDRNVATLSGGERQRVGLVRALAAAPGLVLFDEPFSALNESLRRELWDLIHALRREENVTILFVTHDLTEAFYLSDRMTILLEGRSVQQGTKSEVYDCPATPAAAAFLGYRNIFRGRVETHPLGCVVEHRGLRIVVPEPPPGDEAIVCIRPQAIKIIHEDRPIRDELAANRFAAEIEEIVRLPELAIVHIRAVDSGGVRLEMRLPMHVLGRMRLEAGRRVTAALWAPALRVYPAGETGLANARGAR